MPLISAAADCNGCVVLLMRGTLDATLIRVYIARVVWCLDSLIVVEYPRHVEDGKA